MAKKRTESEDDRLSTLLLSLLEREVCFPIKPYAPGFSRKDNLLAILSEKKEDTKYLLVYGKYFKDAILVQQNGTTKYLEGINFSIEDITLPNKTTSVLEFIDDLSYLGLIKDMALCNANQLQMEVT